MKIETKIGNPGSTLKGRKGSELTVMVRQLKEGEFVEVTGVHDAHELLRLKSRSYQAAKRAGFLFETRTNAKAGTLRIYRLAGPQVDPDPRRRQISGADPFFGQRPSEFLPNVRNVAGRATALLGLWHIDSHVSAYGRGWYGVVDNTTNEIKKPYLRGAAMVDDFIEAAVRLHLEAQKEPA